MLVENWPRGQLKTGRPARRRLVYRCFGPLARFDIPASFAILKSRWVESAAGHLVKRSWLETHGEGQRAQVATIRGSFPLVDAMDSQYAVVVAMIGTDLKVFRGSPP